jgi:hypothetical protein
MQIAPRAGCATWRRETRSRAGAFSLGRSRVSIEGSRVSIEGSRVSIEGSRAESGCSRAAGVLGELSPGPWECVAFGKPWDLLPCNGRTRGRLKSVRRGSTRDSLAHRWWPESLSLCDCELFQSEDLRRHRLLRGVRIPAAPLTGLSSARQAAVTPRTKQSRRRTPEPAQSGRRRLSGGARVTTTPRHSCLASRVMTAR